MLGTSTITQSVLGTLLFPFLFNNHSVPLSSCVIVVYSMCEESNNKKIRVGEPFCPKYGDDNACSKHSQDTTYLKLINSQCECLLDWMENS